MFTGIHMCTKNFISFFLVNYHYHQKNTVVFNHQAKDDTTK